METRGIAVFDVCGTITKTNNTSDFIGFILRRDGAFACLPFVLLRIGCLLCRIPGLRRLVSAPRLRERQIALLRGRSAAHLRESGNLYAEALFAQGLVNGRILDAMRREKEQGRTIVLVSAAIDPPIAAIASRLGIRDFISSELETVDGRCTGRLERDLLGRKQTVLEKIVATADLSDSSVYSDNPEDAKFMESFARRYVVLNARAAERHWSIQGGEVQRVINYDAARNERDVDSINKRTRAWVYIPLFYYVISRFHRTGLSSLLLREVVPTAFVGCWFTTLGVSSFVLMPLSFLIFYSVYEIGGLVNDLLARKETPGTGTRRISPDVRIHVPLFLTIRVAVVAMILAWLPLGVRPLRIYTGMLLLCLGIYLTHSIAVAHWRVVTFALLKACRNCIPLLILAPYAPPTTLAWLCAIFFLLDGPWRVYLYCRQAGLVQAGPRVSHVRCANVLILSGVGAAVYFVAGRPHLLMIASYYVLLECLWIIRAVSPVSVPFGRSSIDDRQMDQAGASSPPGS
jgi:phosphoserine phosphatase